jgi:hypothetical protein
MNLPRVLSSGIYVYLFLAGLFIFRIIVACLERTGFLKIIQETRFKS